MRDIDRASVVYDIEDPTATATTSRSDDFGSYLVG